MLVPNRLLVRFEFALRYRKPPRIDGDLADWSDEYLLPDFSGMDGQDSFARIWMAWHESGLCFACQVQGRSSPFQCNPKEFWKGDNVRLCTDMRDARDNKRASRFCQQFYFLPAGGGKNGSDPIAGSTKIHRATEHAPQADPGSIAIASKRRGKTYALEAHVHASALSGFDPEEHPRIGIYTIVEDSDLGQQYLTVGDDLNWHIDPSTWATGVLSRS